MDLDGVIENMEGDIRAVEPKIIDHWGRGDYQMARAEFLGFLARTRYHYFKGKIIDGFDRGVNAIESIICLGELLDSSNNFSTRNISRGIKQVKVSLAMTSLSDGPVY